MYGADVTGGDVKGGYVWGRDAVGVRKREINVREVKGDKEWVSVGVRARKSVKVRYGKKAEGKDKEGGGSCVWRGEGRQAGESQVRRFGVEETDR